MRPKQRIAVRRRSRLSSHSIGRVETLRRRMFGEGYGRAWTREDGSDFVRRDDCLAPSPIRKG